MLYYYDTGIANFCPVELPARIKIATVAAGIDHVVVVSNENIVYAYGDGTRGQLGLGSCLSFSILN